jgi:two-component system chemotaxis sensor kinase CheA
MSDYLDINNEELLKDFFAEAEQQVDNLESNILVIENDPSNHEAIDEIFRAAHTLKGGSATVEMNELTEFTHTVEDLLDELRSDSVKVTEPVVDTLFNAIDVIKAMLESRANGAVYEKNTSELADKIKSFIPEKKKTKKAPPKPSSLIQKKSPAPVVEEKSVSTAAIRPLSETEYSEMKEACTGKQKLWQITVRFDEKNPMNSVGGIQVFAALKAVGSVLKTIPDFDALYEDTFYPEVYYYIASESASAEIEEVAFLNDVTLSTDAQRIDNLPAASVPPAVKPAETAQPAETVQQQESAAVTEVVSDTVETEAAEAPVTAGEKKVEADEDKNKSAVRANHVQTGSLLRVDSRRIDYLLNLVSETVITKASFNQIGTQLSESLVHFQNLDTLYKEKITRLFEQLPQYLEQIEKGAAIKDIKAAILQEFGELPSHFDSFGADFKSMSVKFRSSTQNLGRITGELQEGVMKIRMVPISQIFSRFPRVVRDLQRNLNKKITLEIQGEETELDKSVIDDLLDPIMHCVRNSADHGIEEPDVRKAAGKPEHGTILLKAANEGNMIVIDIADDGAGIDVQKVRQKAVDKGLVSPNKIISDQEAYQLIFEPGFSTSDKISNVSGRGVGLDVVRTMVEKLNGTVTVTSKQGQGTKFSIRLPLTLAIIQGLLVRVGREVYSIPIASVIESHRVKKQEISTIDNYEVLNVRNEVISILRLSRLFNIKDANNGEYRFIVIVGSQDKKIGIMVDALIGEEDVVIKPLRDQFTNSPGIAGASILGDGSVSLIIDVSQLLELGVRQEIDAQNARELTEA